MQAVWRYTALILITIDIISGEEDCSNISIEECFHGMDEMRDNPALSGLAATKEDQLLACKLFEAKMKCIDDYASRCMKTDQRALLERKVAGSRSMMKAACNDTHFQGHWPTQCRELSSIVGQCMKPMQRVWQQRQNYVKEEGLKEMCCAQRMVMSCISLEMKRVCEATAVPVAMNRIESAFSSHLRQKCRTIAAPCSGCLRIAWSTLPLACLVLLRFLWAVA